MLDLDKRGRLGKTPRQRFEEYVDRTGDCHLWVGAKAGRGYGQLWIAGQRFKAHRVAREMVNGPVPDGLVVCHRCNNFACVNPAHLYVATQRQNALDAVRDGLARPRRGQDNGMARLADAQIATVKEYRSSGMPYRAIEKLTGVSATHARHICTGKRRATP